MSTNDKPITILVAEDNDISREMIIALLRGRGYNTVGVADGAAAIDAIKLDQMDLALVDINMEPKGGFAFVKHLVAQDIDIPVVIITADESSDILMKASGLGVVQVIQKPLNPDRLIETVRRVLKRRGLNPDPLAHVVDSPLSSENIMLRAIELAAKNAANNKGGPYAAIVADRNGQILGEGVNGMTSRVDPMAHAEVMAIRQASERLGRADLSDCVLYCSSEPTMIGKALITSVAISEVYFGLSHDDIADARADVIGKKEIISAQPVETAYQKLCTEQALSMIKKSIRAKKSS